MAYEKKIKIEAFIKYWDTNNEEQVECLALLLEKKLAEIEYRKLIESVIEIAIKDLKTNISLK
jgi:hypothetical protein